MPGPQSPPAIAELEGTVAAREAELRAIERRIGDLEAEAAIARRAGAERELERLGAVLGSWRGELSAARSRLTDARQSLETVRAIVAQPWRRPPRPSR